MNRDEGLGHLRRRVVGGITSPLDAVSVPQEGSFLGEREAHAILNECHCSELRICHSCLGFCGHLQIEPNPELLVLRRGYADRLFQRNHA